jgi:hypothetical protein
MRDATVPLALFLLAVPCMQAFTIKCADDALAFLAKEGSQDRFESYLKTWMKKIQVMILFGKRKYLVTYLILLIKL